MPPVTWGDLKVTLEVLSNAALSIVLIGVTGYYAHKAAKEARRANSIAAKAERDRLEELTDRRTADQRLAEGDIAIAAYGLHRQLASWVSESPIQIEIWAMQYASVKRPGDQIQHASALSPIEQQRAESLTLGWLDARTPQDLDRAEARVVEMNSKAPRARPEVENGVRAIADTFFEATRRMTEQRRMGHRGRMDPYEIVLAVEDLRASLKLVMKVSDRLGGAYRPRPDLPASESVQNSDQSPADA